jgi:hypothetical protein
MFTTSIKQRHKSTHNRAKKQVYSVSENLLLVSGEKQSRSTVHRVEKILVALLLSEFINQKFHPVRRIHRSEQLTQNPYAVQDIFLEQQVFLPGP